VAIQKLFGMSLARKPKAQRLEIRVLEVAIVALVEASKLEQMRLVVQARLDKRLLKSEATVLLV